jgi:hypothetical protein
MTTARLLRTARASPELSVGSSRMASRPSAMTVNGSGQLQPGFGASGGSTCATGATKRCGMYHARNFQFNPHHAHSSAERAHCRQQRMQ